MVTPSSAASSRRGMGNVSAERAERAAARYGSIHERWGRSRAWGTAEATLAHCRVETRPILSVGSESPSAELPALERPAPELPPFEPPLAPAPAMSITALPQPRPRLTLLEDHDDVPAPSRPHTEPAGTPKGVARPSSLAVRVDAASPPRAATALSVPVVRDTARLASRPPPRLAGPYDESDATAGAPSRFPTWLVLAAVAFAAATALVPSWQAPEPGSEATTADSPESRPPRSPGAETLEVEQTTHALQEHPGALGPLGAPASVAKAESAAALHARGPEDGAAPSGSTLAPTGAAAVATARTATTIPAQPPPVDGPGQPRTLQGPRRKPTSQRGGARSQSAGVAPTRATFTAKKRVQPARKRRPRRQKAPRNEVRDGIIRDSPF